MTAFKRDKLMRAARIVDLLDKYEEQHAAAQETRVYLDSAMRPLEAMLQLGRCITLSDVINDLRRALT